MATTKKISAHIKANNDTGFGSNPGTVGGRFINKDGTLNLRREGISLLDRFSVYQRMLVLPTWKFIGIILLVYAGLNIIFSAAYLLVGTYQLQGFVGQTSWERVKEVFYFSAQTFTTVGYGRVNPVGDGANLIATIEALTGFLSFAIATGLIYGRFARPRTYLAFSDLATISPYKGKTAFMFRFANYKDNHILSKVEILVTAALRIDENGIPEYKFYDLKLERQKVDMLPMNWTVVHIIDEDSPLNGFTYNDLVSSDFEVYIQISGFDEVYSSYVLARTSYTYNEVKFNIKYVPMYRESEDEQMTILELHKLNEVVEIK